MATDEEPEGPISDTADRLVHLIRRLQEAAKEPSKHPGNVLSVRPMHESFEPIAKFLNFGNYAELRDQFVALCNRVRRDIETLSMRRETTRSLWVASVDAVKSVFDAENFGEQTGKVFSKCFSNHNIERLEAASERLQMSGVTETEPDKLEEALSSARKVLNAYEKHGTVSEQLSVLLKHYLQQMEIAIQRYDDFGEEKFWSTYKEFFATFIQTHKIILPDDVADEVKQAMNEMAEKMVWVASPWHYCQRPEYCSQWRNSACPCGLRKAVRLGNFYAELDATNSFNPGIGKTSKQRRSIPSAMTATEPQDDGSSTRASGSGMH